MIFFFEISSIGAYMQELWIHKIASFIIWQNQGFFKFSVWNPIFGSFLYNPHHQLLSMQTHIQMTKIRCWIIAITTNYHKYIYVLPFENHDNHAKSYEMNQMNVRIFKFQIHLTKL